MQTISMLHSFVYLDTGYIAELYEVESGESSTTQITKNQGKKAGAQLPIFTAEVSAQETRSFTMSTFSMLTTLMPMLNKEPTLDAATFSDEMESKYGWINGELTVFKVSSSVRDGRTGENKTMASDALYQIRQKPGVDIALITTPEYFAPGLGTFVKLQHMLLKEMSVPVRVYIRVMAGGAIRTSGSHLRLLCSKSVLPNPSLKWTGILRAAYRFRWTS